MKREIAPLAISCGDPSGIGPYIALNAALALAKEHPSVLFGDAEQLHQLARHAPAMPLSVFGTMDEWTPSHQAVSVIDVCRISSNDISKHTPNAACGNAQLQFLKRAADAVMHGKARALVTAPMSKASVSMSGVNFHGHTEFLADIAGLATDAVSMLFLGPRLKTALVTTHLSLKHVPMAITAKRVTRAIVHAAEAILALARAGQVSLPASLVVCGLNPHAGEEGLFGLEESQHIAPGMHQARQHAVFNNGNVELVGPLGAETAFRLAASGTYAAAVAMYHDQATIASKLLDWNHAVNVTWGLPFVRTSVDHGVAYDAAKTGTADATAMVAAMRVALDLSQ